MHKTGSCARFYTRNVHTRIFSCQNVLLEGSYSIDFLEKKITNYQNHCYGDEYIFDDHLQWECIYMYNVPFRNISSI